MIHEIVKKVTREHSKSTTGEWKGADMDVEVYLIKKNYFTKCQTFRGNFYNY